MCELIIREPPKYLPFPPGLTFLNRKCRYLFSLTTNTHSAPSRIFSLISSSIDLAAYNYNRARMWEMHEANIAVVFQMSQNITLAQTLVSTVSKRGNSSQCRILRNKIKSSDMLLLWHKGQSSYYLEKAIFLSTISSFSFCSQHKLVLGFCWLLHYILTRNCLRSQSTLLTCWFWMMSYQLLLTLNNSLNDP